MAARKALCLTKWRLEKFLVILKIINTSHLRFFVRQIFLLQTVQKQISLIAKNCLAKISEANAFQIYFLDTFTVFGVGGVIMIFLVCLIKDVSCLLNSPTLILLRY